MDSQVSEFQAHGLITGGLEGQRQEFCHSGTAWGLPEEPRHRKHPAERARGRLASREAADWDQEALGGLPHATLHLPRVGAPCCEALPRQVEQELGSVGSTLPLCRAGPGSTREWRPVRHQATLPVAQNFLCRHIAGPGQAITPEQCQRPVRWRPHPRHSSHLS